MTLFFCILFYSLALMIKLIPTYVFTKKVIIPKLTAK